MQALIKYNQEKKSKKEIKKEIKKRGCAYFGRSLMWSVVCNAEKWNVLKICFCKFFRELLHSLF